MLASQPALAVLRQRSSSPWIFSELGFRVARTMYRIFLGVPVHRHVDIIPKCPRPPRAIASAWSGRWSRRLLVTTARRLVRAKTIMSGSDREEVAQPSCSPRRGGDPRSRSFAVPSWGHLIQQEPHGRISTPWLTPGRVLRYLLLNCSSTSIHFFRRRRRADGGWTSRAGSKSAPRSASPSLSCMVGDFPGLCRFHEPGPPPCRRTRYGAAADLQEQYGRSAPARSGHDVGTSPYC